MTPHKKYESLIVSVLKHPMDAWENMSIYQGILSFPFVLVYLVIGLPIALIVDFFVSCNRILKGE